MSLDWHLNSPDLAELVPDAGGQLQLDGRLSGRRDGPRIEAHASGQALNLATLHIGTIDGTVDVMPQQPWQTLGNIKIENLQWDNHNVRSLAFTSNRQRLSLTAAAEEGDIDLIIDGGSAAQTSTASSTKTGDSNPLPLSVSTISYRLLWRRYAGSDRKTAGFV